MEPQQLLLCTPTDGDPATAHVHWAYMTAREQLIRGGAVTIPATLAFADDLSRARSRLAAHALDRPGWKWMLWWDDDVAPRDPQLVPRMLARAVEFGHDVLCAPYPRKRMPPTMCYVSLPEHARDGRMPVDNDCVEILCAGFGFMLTSRKCLEAMTAYYAHEWFTDKRLDGPTRRVVALFKQVHTGSPQDEYRDLMSEDHSFCYRWRAMGGKIQMYVGEGAPVPHLGGYAYTAGSEDLGRVA